MGDDGIGRAKAGSEPALWSSSVASPAPIALLIRPLRPRAVEQATVRACARVWPWLGLRTPSLLRPRGCFDGGARDGVGIPTLVTATRCAR